LHGRTHAWSEEYIAQTGQSLFSRGCRCDTHMHVHTHTCTHICTDTHTHTRTYAHTHIQIHRHTDTQAHKTHRHTYTHTNSLSNTYICMCSIKRTTDSNTHTHTHAHTHTLSLSVSLSHTHTIARIAAERTTDWWCAATIAYALQQQPHWRNSAIELSHQHTCSLRHTANLFALQHIAKRCNSLQHTATHVKFTPPMTKSFLRRSAAAPVPFDASSSSSATLSSGGDDNTCDGNPFESPSRAPAVVGLPLEPPLSKPRSRLLCARVRICCMRVPATTFTHVCQSTQARTRWASDNSL